MPDFIDENLIHTYVVYLTVFLLKKSNLLKINTLKVNFSQCPVVFNLCLSFLVTGKFSCQTHNEVFTCITNLVENHNSSSIFSKELVIRAIYYPKWILNIEKYFYGSWFFFPPMKLMLLGLCSDQHKKLLFPRKPSLNHRVTD